MDTLKFGNNVEKNSIGSPEINLPFGLEDFFRSLNLDVDYKKFLDLYSRIKEERETDNDDDMATREILSTSFENGIKSFNRLSIIYGILKRDRNFSSDLKKELKSLINVNFDNHDNFNIGPVILSIEKECKSLLALLIKSAEVLLSRISI